MRVATAKEASMDAELNMRERELVALAAAVASNCIPCVEYHTLAARKAGVTDAHMGEAVRIADTVRRVPARKVLRAALAGLEDRPTESAETLGSVCGCSKAGRGDRAPSRQLRMARP